jgi:hypothetical protein
LSTHHSEKKETSPARRVENSMSTKARQSMEFTYHIEQGRYLYYVVR